MTTPALTDHVNRKDREFLAAQRHFIQRYKTLFTTRWDGSTWAKADNTWQAAHSYFSAIQIPGTNRNMQTLSDRLNIPEDRFQQFIRESPWEHLAVQQALNEDLPPEFRSPEAILHVDGMPIIKDGKQSVGVARQWAGNVGKVANSQHAVDLTLTIPGEERNADQVTWPLGMELYVPEEWLTEPEYASRREDARIPEDLPFRKKWEIALALINRSLDAGVPHACLGADSEFGDVKEFRATLRDWGEPYLLEVTPSELRVIPEETPIDWPEEHEPDGRGRPPTVPQYPETMSPASPEEIATALDTDPPEDGDGSDLPEWVRDLRDEEWTEVSWTEGSDGEAFTGEFFRTRVRTVTSVQRRAVSDETGWLLIGRRDDRLKAWICWGLDDREWSLKRLVRYATHRWTIEQFHREAKQYLGINEFEGRTWDGWHHHVTMVMLAYAFLSRERALHDNAASLPRLSELAYEATRETCIQELMEELEMERDRAEEAASTQLRVIFGKR